MIVLSDSRIVFVYCNEVLNHAVANVKNGDRHAHIGFDLSHPGIWERNIHARPITNIIIQISTLR
jgi:hypothetical protein